MSNEKSESNVLKNKFGDEVPWDGSVYPDGSPAKEGHSTPPSGQGGATPKSRPDYQDMWPANPEPSESAKAKGEENDKVDKGEVSPINPDGVDRPTQTKATHKEEKK